MADTTKSKGPIDFCSEHNCRLVNGICPSDKSAKHTPTPLKAIGPEIYTDAGKTSKRIAFATGLGNGDAVKSAEQNANAAFIVRACNAHEELVAFVQKVANSTIVPQQWSDEAYALVDKAKGGAA